MNRAAVPTPVRPAAHNRPSAWSLAQLMGGQAVVAGVGLLSGKLTASYVPPAELGRYNLGYATLAFGYSLLMAPTLRAFKAYVPGPAANEMVNFYGRLLLLLAGLMAIGMGVGAVWTGQPVWFLIGLAGVGQSAWAFGSDYLNVTARHRIYARLQAAYAVANLVLLAGWVVGLGQRTAAGLWGVLVLLNGTFAGLALRYAYRADPRFRPQPKPFGSWLTTVRLNAWRGYAAPLVGLGLWSGLANYADRYLLRLFMTDADVGQYAVGYGLGSKVLLVSVPLVAYLTPVVYQRRAGPAPDVAVRTTLTRYIAGYGLGMSGCCLLYYRLRDAVGQLLLSDAYAPAFAIGPVIAVAYLLLTTAHLFEIKQYAFGQTRLILGQNAAGAVVNVVLNLLLIPRFGLLGAAFATLGGFGCQLIITFLNFYQR